MADNLLRLFLVSSRGFAANTENSKFLGDSAKYGDNGVESEKQPFVAIAR